MSSLLKLKFAVHSNLSHFATFIFPKLLHLDAEDKGKLSESEIMRALVTMGVEMDVPSDSVHSNLPEMAWEGIVRAVEAARLSKQQIVETEHLIKSLLEQKDGLARRILTKAGLDNSSVLQAIDDFISEQPKVVGDTSGPILGTNLGSLLDKARKHKKEMGDDFVSVEHLILAFQSDSRLGKQLFQNFNLGEKDLKDAIQAVRGSQRVTDQKAGQRAYLKAAFGYIMLSTTCISSLCFILRFCLGKMVQGNLAKDEMIKRVFVFSDMEFDQASANPWETDYQVIREQV